MVAPQNLLSNIPPSRLSKSRSKSSSSVTPSMTITSRPPELFLSFTSAFCNCGITSKCDLRWRQCSVSAYQQICTFYPRQQEIPFPLPPGQLGMGVREWVSSAGFILNAPSISANHPPSNACLIPFPPDLTMSDHTVRLWPHSTIVTTQSVVTWTQYDSQTGHSTGSHCV